MSPVSRYRLSLTTAPHQVVVPFALIAIFGTAAVLNGCGSGGSNVAASTPTASPTPTPRASATPTPAPTPTPVATPTPTPVATPIPTPTPTPAANAYSLTFSAPPAGDVPGTENPNPSQDVALTGEVDYLNGAPVSITLNAQHGTATAAQAYVFTFSLSDVNGLQVGKVYQAGVYATTYTEYTNNVVTDLANSIGSVGLASGGTFTVASISGGRVHLIGSNILMQNTNNTSTATNIYDYFTMNFDITANLTAKNGL